MTLYLVMDKKTMLVWGNAATKASCARKLETILGIELLTASQAIEFRDLYYLVILLKCFKILPRWSFICKEDRILRYKENSCFMNSFIVEEDLLTMA
jgi:histidine ammonia-lyase